MAAGLFLAFRFYGLTVGPLSGEQGATIILYTLMGYLITFAVLVYSILKRQIIGVRLALVADIVISLPAKAFIAILVAIISIALTFTQSVKAYFSWTATAEF